MKRRKDSGFTLIELMIVIAVIGILAIVLVPKVGTVKTQSKTAGLDTNIRLVQGYCESKIDKWISKSTTTLNVATEIRDSFTSTDDTKKAVNPYTSKSTSATSAAALPTVAGDYSIYIVNVPDDAPDTIAVNNSYLAGAILVVIENSDGAVGTVPIEAVHLYAYDQDGKVLSEKTVVVKP
ncbi:MAG: type II secretion system protein [Peptococcaceae bacterium]|nr:type II secretion system protein [Peptococcaceae bacterium]